MSLAEIAAVVGGTVADDPHGAVVSGPATVDSREVAEGGLFAAFVGERVDGHAYAGAAVAAGAAAVLGSRPTGYPTVLVTDPQVALAELARHVLAGLPDVIVLAVTGSQGKTSTKDLLAGVLLDAAPTVATRGSFNNELGLPLTVLQADLDTRYLLLEMGARGAGHLRELCRIAPPDVSVVLNVGKAHLGEFGTQDDIARAKGELVEALAADGVAVLNADDPRVRGMATRTTARVLTFGAVDAGSGAEVTYGDVRLDDEGRPSAVLRHGGRTASLTLQLVGAHHVTNAAAAAAAAVAVGLDLDAVAASLGRVGTLSRWRMEVHQRSDGVTVVNDAYNANPDSMAAALRALMAIGGSAGSGHPPRRRIAVIGEMRELGASAAAEHAAVGRLARTLGVDVLVVVGEAARPALEDRPADANRRDGMTQTGGTVAIYAPDNDSAAAWLTTHLRPQDVVLVKASRGARLDEVASVLTQQPDAASGKTS